MNMYIHFVEAENTVNLCELDRLIKMLFIRPPFNHVAQTVTEKLMTFALGRSIEYYDMPTVRKIVRDAAQDNYRFSSIVIGIAKSAPFQMRRIEKVSSN